MTSEVVHAALDVVNLLLERGLVNGQFNVAANADQTLTILVEDRDRKVADEFAREHPTYKGFAIHVEKRPRAVPA